MRSFGKEQLICLIDTCTPLPSAIFFMQKGDTGFRHAGIVAKSTPGVIATIEGNTMPDPTDAAMDREGDASSGAPKHSTSHGKAGCDSGVSESNTFLMPPAINIHHLDKTEYKKTRLVSNEKAARN